MTTSIWLLAIVLIGIGLAGLVVPVLPGPILLFAGLVVAAWAEEFVYVGNGTLAALGIMALAGLSGRFSRRLSRGTPLRCLPSGRCRCRLRRNRGDLLSGSLAS